MSDFLKRFLKGNSHPAPDFSMKIFHEKFPHAINTEWIAKNGGYEAVFYIDTVEHIAEFTMYGELLSYKMFLPKEYLPGIIKTDLEERGEIMNVVLINNGNSIFYEAIIRVEKKIRKLIILTDMGRLMEERKL